MYLYTSKYITIYFSKWAINAKQSTKNTQIPKTFIMNKSYCIAFFILTFDMNK